MRFLYHVGDFLRLTRGVKQAVNTFDSFLFKAAEITNKTKNFRLACVSPFWLLLVGISEATETTKTSIPDSLEFLLQSSS